MKELEAGREVDIAKQGKGRITMKKKLFLLLMSLMMVFAFAACGSSSEEAAEEETTAAETSVESISGGWEIDLESAAAELPEEVQEAFNKAIQQLDGNDLTPIAYFSKQIVAGTNYQILCRSLPGTENPIPKRQVVVI